MPVVISEFVGLHTNADAVDIPNEAAQAQDNLECLTPGSLTVRPGLIKDANYSGATANDIISLFYYQRPEDNLLITVDVNGDLKSRESDGTVTTLASGLDVTEPYSFAKDRFGNLIAVNGTERGWWWNGDTGQTAVPLGITAPASAPTVGTSGSGQNLSEGDYVAAIRFLDDESNPIYSAISPLATFTAADGEQADWSGIPGAVAESRVAKIELWRSRAGASNVLYFISEITVGAATTFTDDTLTDEDLLTAAVEDDTKRLVIIGSGGLQIARRQGVPPTNKGVVVNFQDRMFYFADPSASQAVDRESLYFSFADESESVHATNVVTRQINVQDTDDLIGGLAFGRLMYVFSDRHCYTVDFQQQPNIDANIRLFQARGLAGKDCWDTYEDQIFGLDHIGPWRMSVGGAIDDEFAWKIQDQFRGSTLDWANRKWFKVRVERARQLVWYFVGFTADSSTRPKRAFVYNLRTDAWWSVTLPSEIGGACPLEATGRLEMAVAAQSDTIVLVGGGTQDNFGSPADISYSWKSKVLALDANKDGGGRRLELWLKNPVDGSATLQLYEDRSATASDFGVTADDINVQTTKDNSSATLQMDDTDGYHQMWINLKTGFEQQSVRWLELEITGTQSSDGQHGIDRVVLEGAN